MWQESSFVPLIILPDSLPSEPLEESPPNTHNTSLNMRKTSDDAKLRDVLQNV